MCKTLDYGICVKPLRFRYLRKLIFLWQCYIYIYFLCQIATFRVDEPNYPYSVPAEVCVLADCKDKKHFMAGYSNGDLRVFNYVTKSLVAVLRGHSSSVYCITVDGLNSGLAASGGSDCDIILWDLVSLTATCKLSGHKDAVTALGFVLKGSQRLLVSVSKDTLLKVWDIDSNHCIQTVVGHRSEIWSLQVIDSSRVITGSNDNLLRGFRLVEGGHEVSQDPGADSTTDAVLEYFGCVRRDVSGADRCASIAINAAQSVIVSQSNGKFAEVICFVLLVLPLLFNFRMLSFRYFEFDLLLNQRKK